MNDLYIEYLLSYEEIGTQKEKKIEIGFLDKFGEGKTGEDEIIQNLIFTCEEGIDYRKV
ncbi:hypothetical protein SMGD1_1501 [Sulfurimonas gotlandica GD1]|uniref:Uncharacterized protein n=1 Tax=Sulfurimonas gotlandica (strain DSM 19862 / JCM 16533 / GD1) TaxID=929558 RepID=B6BHM7_SULGG|nr:hypothetical protein [Sulfurimonas gotlandica]EDZ63043.1 hypothetical protein CBGD1_662 [Sulfurimonas gotlandica GD1]EHP30025.1 hypothetical protein SMGD1_1501 [Sulfurimonas gotlandica GD1]